MSDGVFSLIDPQKLVSGEAAYDPGQISAPSGGEPIPVGVVLDARIGRHRVRFLCVVPTGESPRFLIIWNPARPKRLKPAHLKKYRRERRNFAVEVARDFGLPLKIIDRMDGAPKITDLVYDNGTVEPVEPAIPLHEIRMH